MHIALIHSKFEDLEARVADLNPGGPVQMSNTVTFIKTALENNSHKVTSIEADNYLLSNLEKIDTPDLLFNLSTGILDKRTQANIVGLLEMTNIPMLGSSLTTHILGLHKELTKSILVAHGIPTARYQLIASENAKINEDFIYPLIVKPEHEGSGIGVTASSKVDSPDQLQAIIQDKITLHEQVLLVEEYLPGREFTVGVMGNIELEILPIKETIFMEEGPQLLTNELKENTRNEEGIPASLSEELQLEIEEMVEKTYRILRCRDFARVDVRLDREGTPNIIELNTFPGLEKGLSYFPLMAEAAGYSYDELINRLVEIAMEPRGLQ